MLFADDSAFKQFERKVAKHGGGVCKGVERKLKAHLENRKMMRGRKHLGSETLDVILKAKG